VRQRDCHDLATRKGVLPTDRSIADGMGPLPPPSDRSRRALALTASTPYDAGMAPRPRPLSEQIREAIQRSGVSRYAICKALDLEQSAMSRFMSGKGGLSLEVLDRLGLLFGLSLQRRFTVRLGVMKPVRPAKDR